MNPSERTVGYFPLSIGTSLSIEGAIGIHPDHPAGPKVLKDFNGHMVNVKTLFRNYYEAIGRDAVVNISDADLIDYFRREIADYQSIAEEQSGYSFKTFLYCPDYIGLDTRFKHAVLRVDSTANQVLYNKTLRLVLGQIIKNEKELISLYPSKVTDIQPSKTLALTNFAYDLTSKVSENLSLLESHTGAIKDRSKWYTKFYNGKELPTIPFNECFLAIFGDTQLFRPIGPVYRRNLLELSQKYHWSFATSKDKVLYGIDSLKDRYLAENLRTFFKHW